MTANTIFDRGFDDQSGGHHHGRDASFVEQGKIELSAPAAITGRTSSKTAKKLVTIRELMTHYSGLPPDLELKPAWTGYDTAMQMIVGYQARCAAGHALHL